jgi:glycosyltransferase involved in cell wall biosynthesis
MAGGKPVIATGYSGNVDFMTDANSCLVPFRLREIPEGCFPYPPGTPWAEPDVVVAAALMRRVYADRAWAEALGARAAADMSNAFAPEARADFLNARLRAARTRPVRHRMPVLLRPTTQRLKTLVRPVRGAARRISRAAGSRSRSAS